MINHIVLFKLKETFSADEKSQIIEELKTKLLALKGKISELKDIEVGGNFELPSKSYDIALITKFDNVEDLNVYAVHPEHLKVVERIKATTCNRAAVDFES